MVVCKYFLQGNCRYGSSCYYDHEAPGNSTQQHTSILRQPTFGTQQQQHQQLQTKNATNVDLSTLTKAVIADMSAAEKGGQWILSSYAPFKEKPAFPGFDDQSFEEIRLGFYEASKNGTLDQYKQQLQVSYQDALQKVRALQNPSQEIITLLQNIYNSSSNNQVTSNIMCTSNTPSTLFGTPNQNQTSNNNIFGGGLTVGQGQNIFATNQQQQSTFGGNIFAQPAPHNASSIFGGAAQPSGSTTIFGGGAQASGSTAIFGGASANQPTAQNIFASGNPASDHSVFGGNQQGGLFGNSQPNNTFSNPQPATTNIFANANSSPFGASQLQGNIFASNKAATSQGSNIFQQPQNLGFGAKSPETSIFGTSAPTQQQQQQPTNIFAPQLNTTANSLAFSDQSQPVPQQGFGNQQNVFQSQPNQPPANQSAPIFGAPPPEGNLNIAQNQSSSNTVIFGGVQPNNIVDETVYSLEEELTEEEKQWFLSEDLDISKIPERPPTLRMCVKT